MALLIGLTVRFPSYLLRALVATAFLSIGLIFGLVWSAALDKSQFTQANTVVKLWTFINLATLCGLIAYSWINRDKESGEEGPLPIGCHCSIRAPPGSLQPCCILTCPSLQCPIRP